MWNVARSFMVAAVAAAGFVIAYAPLSAQPPPPCDFINAGGYVITDHDAEANFGTHAGCKNGSFWGYLNYVDHGGFLETAPYHVNSLVITGYFETGSNMRDVCGMAQTNADEAPVYFRARMVSNEQGTPDAFGIRLSNGYLVKLRPLGDGGPGGGDIRIHSANPSTTGPDPLEVDAMCAGLQAPTGGQID